MSKREVDIRLKQLNRQCQNLDEQISCLETLVSGRIIQLRKTLASLRTLETDLDQSVEAYRVAAEKDARKETRELERKVKELEAEARRRGSRATLSEIDETEVDKASTLAIFDSIIFAISNWSTEGDTASDFELACQAALFPTVYERVMKGEADYYITKVPHSADIVVERGREYVKHFRSILPSSLVAPDAWDEHAQCIQQWWVRDALPLLYGGRADQWDEDIPLSLVEVLEWRDQPASRALHFPLIFDGLELVKKHGDRIRETTGLPQFNRNTLLTRLQP